jgi:energy-coupling factor transport system substrate-specific component
VKAALSIRDLWSGRGVFETGELVTIGLFAAAAQTTALVVALAGGGMNPLAMAARSAVHSALLVVLMAKVPRGGALTLATLVGGLISLMMMGQAMMALPAALLAAALTEAAFGRIGRAGPRLAAAKVAASEVLSRALNLSMAALALREAPALMALVVVATISGALGAMAGVVLGARLCAELRRAGLIRD